jgi:MarR family
MDCQNLGRTEREVFFEIAKPIIEAPDVFQCVVDTMRARGFAGDPRQVAMLYAIFTSRLLQRPMCAFIKAPSSSGKSWLLNRMLELFPDEAYEIKSGFSPKAIAYGSSDLRHKILAVQEASGLDGREGNMLVRTLISEGQIRWEVTGRKRNGFATREVVRPGPIAFVLTTTQESLHREDETRALSIEVDESKDDQREVIRNIGRRFAGTLKPDAVDLSPWHAYQRWLEAGPRQTVIPFGEALGNLFSIRATRSKRDFEQVLTAISVSALMHQANRAQDGDGRVIATIRDYEFARCFLQDALNQASGTGVPIGVREAVEELMDQNGVVNAYHDRPYGLTMEQLALRLSVDKAAASRRIKKAKALGLVTDLGTGKGRPSRLVVVEPLPDDWDVLPNPEHVEAEARGELDAYLRREAEESKARCERERAEERKAEEEGAEREARSESGEAPFETGRDADRAVIEAQTAPPTPSVPPIIANAPDPNHSDGGYRSRRAIYQFRAAAPR